MFARRVAAGAVIFAAMLGGVGVAAAPAADADPRACARLWIPGFCDKYRG